MNIFISWSKIKSLEFAKSTKSVLEKLDPTIRAFVSEVDIIGGEEVQNTIIQNINSCDKLVLCFTKETKKSPWLLFEAGYARGCGKTVIPILFDADPNWHSWIDNPMNIARELRIDRSSFTIDFLTAFNLRNTTRNKSLIGKYIEEIKTIKETYRPVDVQCADLVDRLLDDGSFHVENPYFRNKTAYFLTGFESFELYKVLINSFLYTGKYLWIYGRKNMKLFSGNYSHFFRYLDEKTLESGWGMDGIDFRCLFLNPDSPEVSRAHKQQEIFRSELKACILRAKEVIGDNDALKKCFRLYSNKRDEIIIRLDNSIIYSRPMFDVHGHPQLLTNTAFEVFSANSNRGKECIAKFEHIWDAADKFI